MSQFQKPIQLIEALKITLTATELLALAATPVELLTPTPLHETLLLFVFAQYHFSTIPYAGTVANSLVLSAGSQRIGEIGTDVDGNAGSFSPTINLGASIDQEGSGPFGNFVNSHTPTVNQLISIQATSALTAGDGTLDLTIFFLIIPNN